MTRQAAQAAGAEAARVPLLREHDSESNVGLLLVTGDRGLAGGFNSRSSAPACACPPSSANRG